MTPKLPNSGKISEFSFRNKKDDQNSFSLPPAAIDPLDENRQSKDLTDNAITIDENTNDKTPLLGGSRSTNLRPHPSIYKRQSLVSNIEEGSPLKRAMSARSGNAPQSYGGGSVVLTDGVPLENLADTGKKEFIEWLDSELQKIENFYKEKEDQAVERFLLLQDQLYQLREQKERLKAKNNNHEHSEELLHIDMDEAKKKLQQINKYEMPSLPKFSFRKKKIKADDDIDPVERSQNRRDYEPRPKPSVPYYVARRQIKNAVQEYYRGLELLKSYRMLNRTGFRKLVKKFDKQTKSNISVWYMEKVNSSYFGTSDVLDNMIPKVEELFSLYFENGNRKVAVEKLRSNIKEDQFYTSMFVSGILFGLSIPLLGYALYLGLHKTLTGEIPEGKLLLQIWAGFFLATLMAVLFSINCYTWTKFKINYRFIFEFNPKTALDYRQYLLLPSLILFLYAIFMWLSFNNFWPERLPARDLPWFFFGLSAILIFFPFDVLFYESRKWLIVTMWRLFLSGLYPVEFRDFFLGDIFCSLTYTIGNASFFFCMYATHWKGAIDGHDSPTCGSSKSRLMGFFSTLPPIWRFLQCFRRYSDSGDWFPHLANMAKYTVTVIYYMLLSVYRIESTMQHRAVFILFAIINSVYSSLWDLFMDWSLIQNKQLLRDDLIYPKWFYYFAMVSDVILRFQWIFYALFSRQIQQSAVTSFCIAVAEILRRLIWIFIRMENEHITNKHLYRASRETPLPYQVTRRSSARYSEEPVQRQDEEGSVGYESIEPQQTAQTPSSMRRRETILNSAVFQNVSKAIVNAHAKDFQRRKTKPGESPEDNASSDDENSDGEDM